MAKWLGNIAEDATINFKFHTTGTDATPTTLSGTPVIKVYKDNATGTETTAGVTLTVDFDSVTGLNNVTIDTSADAFYATGSDYQATSGTLTFAPGQTTRSFAVTLLDDEETEPHETILVALTSTS